MAVYIVRRQSKSGPRWIVRYQPHGGKSGQLHCGSFRRADLAEARKLWCEFEVAAGRVPDPKLIAMVSVETTMRSAVQAYLDSRVDAADSSRQQYGIRCAVILERWNRHAPTSLTRDAIQKWIGTLSESYAPRTIQGIVLTLAQVLDHAGVDPNPARAVRKPKVRRSDYYLPTRAELAALYEALPERYARAVLVMEWTGLRVSEAIALRWSDVDQGRGRILVRDSKTASGRRFVEHLDSYPTSLVDLLANPKVGGERVLPGITRGGLGEAMRDRNPRVHPHSLRHLHASRMLHDEKMSPAVLAARLGHSSPAITLRVYAHVVGSD